MKQIGKNKQDQKETALVLLAAFIWNEIVYSCSKWVTASWRHYDMTSSIDALVPFLPWTITIYFGCYLFWGANYYLCAVQEKVKRDRFFCADALSKAICLIIFLLLPTTNVRPEIADNSIWGSLMSFLYKIDTADNLFPSLHCLVSWFCWIGVRKAKEIPAVYRYFSLGMAVAVCISTLTTRQHVIADVFGGVLLAEGCYAVAGFPKVCAIYTTGLLRLKSGLRAIKKKFLLRSR